MSARVLMVDDSPGMLRLLRSRVSRSPGIEVVGTAGDPYEARDRIAELKPNVLTLDIEMPRMNGLDFLRRLMKHHPIPTVVVSTLAGPRTAVAVEALQLGAVQALGKDQAKQPDVLARAIRAAHGANVAILGGHRPKPKALVTGISAAANVDIIAIGVSTGGPHALAQVFAQLPAGLPPIVVVQHMQPQFTGPLAQRLNKTSAVDIREAAHGRVLKPGDAVIAPGARHLKVRRRGRSVVTELSDDAPVEHHRPSVDVLFHSIARSGLRTSAIVMTGMGRDGAAGLLALRRAGAQTFAQDEASSVVYGMPKEAAKNGAAMRAVSLSEVANTLARSCAQDPTRRSA